MARKERKPRTNADAAEYWARSILSDEAPAGVDVNSVSVSSSGIRLAPDVWGKRTTVTSFSWYPMGVIFRDEHGTVRRVVVNADSYPSRGWASTPTDQGAVRRAAGEYVAKLNATRPARERIEVETLPLTDSHLPTPDNGIQVTPREDDPEPPRHPSLEVPIVFHARDPGPEPVKDPNGCVAGRVEEYTYAGSELVFGDPEILVDDQAYVGTDVPPGAFLRVFDSGRGARVARAYAGTLVWGTGRDAWRAPEAEPYKLYPNSHSLRTGATYKQCPHCAAFDTLHEAWHRRMHGPPYGRGRGCGWKLYSELMARYGSEEGWREARREDWRRVQRERRERQAWVERNFIPLSAVSTDRWALPILRGGYAMRKDAEAFARVVRQRACAERRRQREAEKRATYERQLARFRRGLERKRRKNADIPTLARDTAQTLAAIRERLDSTTTEEDA